MSKSKTYKLILTSKGLNTRKGTILIRRAYEKEKIKYGSIFLITFPRYEVDEIVVRNCEELGFENIFLVKSLRENQFVRCRKWMRYMSQREIHLKSLIIFEKIILTRIYAT